MPNLRNSYSIFEATKPGTYRHIVGLGGWSTNTPWLNEIYDLWGIQYPMKQIADDNIYILTSANSIPSLQQYVLEHYNQATTASLTNIQYGTTIYKVIGKDLVVDGKLDYCSIIDNSIEYDSEKDNVCIETSVNVYNDCNNKINRVYIELENTFDSSKSYFMVYEGNDLLLEKGRQTLVTIIPSSQLTSGQGYKMNIFIQNEKGNYIISRECRKIEY